MDYFLGIDWGGTYIKAGVVTSSGRVLRKKLFVSDRLKSKKIFIESIKSLVADLSGYDIKGVGIGVPGIVDIKKGFIYYLPNINGWKNYPLKKVLAKELKLPVFVDNDANVFALAENCLGAARKAKRVLFFTLGTGLGSAVILDGRILEGSTSAAELGHFPISLTGTKCGCGGYGCIETFLGNKYLLLRYAQLKKGKAKTLNKVKDIFLKAKEGETAAIKVWQEFSYAFGMYLSGMINVFDPDKIVLGGGVSGAMSVFKPMLLKIIKKQAMWPQAKNTKIVKAKLKNAGLIGAGLLAKQKLSK
ncbi:MAG: ROK family protein [Candidatus Omnitrophica bacterium]|nr:ROK family protein [Candidatus Omnitrophota bacterium]